MEEKRPTREDKVREIEEFFKQYTEEELKGWYEYTSKAGVKTRRDLELKYIMETGRVHVLGEIHKEEFYKDMNEKTCHGFVMHNPIGTKYKHNPRYDCYLCGIKEITLDVRMHRNNICRTEDCINLLNYTPEESYNEKKTSYLCLECFNTNYIIADIHTDMESKFLAEYRIYGHHFMPLTCFSNTRRYGRAKSANK